MSEDKGLIGNYRNICEKLSDTVKAVDEAFSEGTAKVIAPAAAATREGIKTAAQAAIEAVASKLAKAWEDEPKPKPQPEPEEVPNDDLGIDI